MRKKGISLLIPVFFLCLLILVLGTLSGHMLFLSQVRFQDSQRQMPLSPAERKHAPHGSPPFHSPQASPCSGDLSRKMPRDSSTAQPRPSRAPRPRRAETMASMRHGRSGTADAVKPPSREPNLRPNAQQNSQNQRHSRSKNKSQVSTSKSSIHNMRYG